MPTVKQAGDIGRFVREARRAAGLRQEDLALALARSQKFLSDLERGKETAPFNAVLDVVQALGGRIEVHFQNEEDARDGRS